MSYRLIALDMDGTLLDDDKMISHENEAWIQKATEQDVIIMLTTGRGIQNIRPYSEQLLIHSPIVAVNGGEIWSSPDVLLKQHLMKHELIKQLRDLAIRLNTWYWAYTTEGLIHKDTWNIEHYDYHNWLKFGFASDQPSKLSQLDAKLKCLSDLEITSSNETNREIGPIGITKASGIAEICELRGFTMEQCVAVGDGANDIPMITACGLGVAMGNASEEVMQIADQITGTNTEHGVAQIIESVLNHNRSLQLNSSNN